MNAAVLVIDMLNFFASEGNESYRDEQFLPVVARTAELVHHARRHSVPVVYINTQFESPDDFYASPLSRKHDLHWLRGSEEAEVVTELSPIQGDDIVVKSTNSGFFQTRLDVVLQQTEARRLYLTGVHTHVCVLLTAADAFYRGLDAVVVRDCVTTMREDRHLFGLDYIERHLGSVRHLAEVISDIDGSQTSDS